MPDETADMTSVGERVRHHRERRGMSRAVLGGLVGRSEDWVKKIERGERALNSLVMILRLARALGCQDVADLMGAGMSAPVDNGGRVVHPGVPALRAAVHAPLFGAASVASVNVSELAGQVRGAWQVWHTARDQRTAVATVLPGLITAAHAALRAADSGGDRGDRRRAAVVLAEVYALAQQYAAHNAETELYWVIVDRARSAAEQADDPVSLASAAWVVGNGLRAAGYTDEARHVVADAADMLRSRLEAGPDRLRGVFGSLCLHAAVTAAQDGRDGDAWRWHDEAARAVRELPVGYAHEWTMFGAGNVRVHAVTIGVDLRTPGIALQQLGDTDPASIPSTERRSRLYLDAAKAEHARRQQAAALQYLRLAYDTSPEATRYVPSARALAATLAREAMGPLSYVAHQLADDIGVAA